MPVSRFHAPPSTPRPAVENRYEQLYGLKENPFPAEPLFSSAESDPRRNGSIYDPQFHATEERRFFDLFVHPPAGGTSRRLGFVRVDSAAGGRGNGKSMFLHRMMLRINTPDWPADFGDTSQLPTALAVHLLPDPKTILGFHQLVYLLFDTLARSRLFDVIDGLLRAAVLHEQLVPEQRAKLAEIPDSELQRQFQDEELFGQILASHSLTPATFANQVEQAVSAQGGATMSRNFLNHLRGNGMRLSALWPKLEAASWNTWREYGTSWLVDGLVPVLLAAGFERLYVLLDEFERIYRFQTGRRRDEFLMALRQTFFEGSSAATRSQFISCILTLHPSVDRYLAENWQVAGLEGLSPLAAGQVEKQAVTLGASTIPGLRHLMQTFLDAYRTDATRGKHMGSLYPFAADALDDAFTAAKRYPRDSLRLAYHIMAGAAATSQPAPLSKDWVNSTLPGALQAVAAADAVPPPEPPQTNLKAE